LDEYKETPCELWLRGGGSGRAPGNVVPFFGAGVSIDAPTNLPPAILLTETLLFHLLPEHAAEDILRVFRRNSEVLGRPVPRLEHLLSAAGACAPEATRLLEIFADVTPNRNHHILAQYLLDTHGYAITPNFDTAVERAGGWRIPVHFFDTQAGTLRTLYGDENADWGLIKVHGTIDTGATSLCATLERLEPGLALPMRDLLHRVLSGADMVLVAGYSGTDHFDVNAFLQDRLNAPYRARLLWIHHQEERPSPPRAHVEPASAGYEVFQNAFGVGPVRAGPTAELLAEVLGDSPATGERAENVHWKANLGQLYAPSMCDRYRMALSLAMSAGLTEIAQYSLDLLRRESRNSVDPTRVYVRTYAAEGRWIKATLALSALRHISAAERRLLKGLNSSDEKQTSSRSRPLVYRQAIRNGIEN
jgi:hypothetical protein